MDRSKSKESGLQALGFWAIYGLVVTEGKREIECSLGKQNEKHGLFFSSADDLKHKLPSRFERLSQEVAMPWSLGYLSL